MNITLQQAERASRELLQDFCYGLRNGWTLGHGLWVPSVETSYGYQLGVRLFLTFRSFHTYEHAGRLRIPRLTRHVQLAELYRSSPGDLWGERFTVLERVVVGEGMKAMSRSDTIRQRFEQLALRAFGIEKVRWSR